MKKTTAEKNEGQGEGGRPKGGEDVLWDTLEGEKEREMPVVREFAELSLLGRRNLQKI